MDLSANKWRASSDEPSGLVEVNLISLLHTIQKWRSIHHVLTSHENLPRNSRLRVRSRAPTKIVVLLAVAHYTDALDLPGRSSKLSGSLYGPHTQLEHKHTHEHSGAHATGC